MIASLLGTVLRLGASSVQLDVAGVGYRVNVTPTHALELRTGQTVRLITHLAVREDAWTLYGFRDDEELEVFEHLISVSGVGPKSALGVLAQLAPAEVARAVIDEDVAAFKRVSGIGPKSAGLIIVSLRGKLAEPSPASLGDTEAHAAPGGAAAVIAPGVRADVIEALVGLGYQEKVAAPAVDDAAAALAVGSEPDGDAPGSPASTAPDVASVLRAALRLLSAPKRRS